VGIVTDSLTGRRNAPSLPLAEIAPQLKLGVSRLPIQRELSPTDFLRLHEGQGRALAALAPDVLHGHGAKGGAFVRLMSGRSAIRVYTPARWARCITGRNSLRGHGSMAGSNAF